MLRPVTSVAQVRFLALFSEMVCGHEIRQVGFFHVLHFLLTLKPQKCYDLCQQGGSLVNCFNFYFMLLQNKQCVCGGEVLKADILWKGNDTVTVQLSWKIWVFFVTLAVQTTCSGALNAPSSVCGLFWWRKLGCVSEIKENIPCPT